MFKQLWEQCPFLGKKHFWKLHVSSMGIGLWFSVCGVLSWTHDALVLKNHPSPSWDLTLAVAFLLRRLDFDIGIEARTFLRHCPAAHSIADPWSLFFGGDGLLIDSYRWLCHLKRKDFSWEGLQSIRGDCETLAMGRFSCDLTPSRERCLSSLREVHPRCSLMEGVEGTNFFMQIIPIQTIGFYFIQILG